MDRANRASASNFLSIEEIKEMVDQAVLEAKEEW